MTCSGYPIRWSLILILAIAAALQGCLEATGTLSVAPEQFQRCAQETCRSILVKRYHVDEPVWTSAVVHRETVMPIEDDQNQDARFSLWRPIRKILQIETRDGARKFTEGVDYRLDNGQLLIQNTGHIDLVPRSRLHAANGEIRISEENQDLQVRVTYLADGPAPMPPAPKPLPGLQAKLRTNKPIYITFYGDSITYGWGSDRGASYVDLAMAYLSATYPHRMYWRNESVAGWSTEAGLSNLDARVNTTAQDVVVIAFGMNDTLVKPEGEDDLLNRAGEVTINEGSRRFKRNILAMVKSIRERAKGTEFVLVSGMRAHPEWGPVDNGQIQKFRQDMLELQSELPGVTVVDVTATWDDLMRRKSFHDVGSNGVNHPNSFGHLIYAQSLIQALVAPIRGDLAPERPLPLIEPGR